MGCTSSQCILSVTFEEQTRKSNHDFTSYTTARAWISSQFPDLCQHPYRLQTFQTPPLTIKNAQDYASLHKRYSGELQLLAVLEKPKRYRPEIFEKLPNSIFKVRKGKEDIEATGFLLSPRLCLIGISREVHQYHALFEDGTSLNFKKDGIMVPIGEFVLTELDLTSQWASKTMLNKPIVMEKDVSHSQGILMYYARNRSVLQELVSKFQVSGEHICFDKKALDNCTSGAPVFSDNGKVFAVYSSNGKAITVAEIAKILEQESEGLDISYQEAIEEALALSSIPIEKSTGIDETWGSVSVFIDSRKSSLVVGGEKEVKGLDAKDGSSIALTPYGVMITGCDDIGNKNKAWIFNRKSIKNISDTNKKHVNHSSIFFQLKVFVISGKYTSAVEVYDFKTKIWEETSKLPSKRIHTSLVISSDTLYMFGGLKPKNKPTKAIWKYTECAWEKCVFKLPQYIIGPGILLIEPGRILVFGGKVSKEDFNLKCWTLSMISGESEEFCDFESEMVFGSYPTTKLEKELAIFSNNGERVAYDRLSKKLVM